MGLSCRFSLNPIHWISQWEPKSSTRTFGEAANMLLCHRDSMMPLGIFRYPKAGLGAGGRKLMNSENNGYYIIYYQYIIIIIVIIIIIYIYTIILYYHILLYIIFWLVVVALIWTSLEFLTLFFPIVYTVFGEETGEVPQSMPVIAVDASESRGGFFTLDVSCRDQSDTPVTMFTIPSGKTFS